MLLLCSLRNALLAILLGLSGTANAAVIYYFDAAEGTGLPDFELRVSSLITTTTTFSLTDFTSISQPASFTFVSVTIGNPLSVPEVEFNLADGRGVGALWQSDSFAGPGVYCAGLGDCAIAGAIMTIVEAPSDVAAPATVLLFALGVSGIAALRQRSVAANS